MLVLLLNAGNGSGEHPKHFRCLLIREERGTVNKVVSVVVTKYSKLYIHLLDLIISNLNLVSVNELQNENTKQFLDEKEYYQQFNY